MYKTKHTWKITSPDGRTFVTQSLRGWALENQSMLPNGFGAKAIAKSAATSLGLRGTWKGWTAVELTEPAVVAPAATTSATPVAVELWKHETGDPRIGKPAAEYHVKIGGEHRATWVRDLTGWGYTLKTPAEAGYRPIYQPGVEGAHNLIQAAGRPDLDAITRRHLTRIPTLASLQEKAAVKEAKREQHRVTESADVKVLLERALVGLRELLAAVTTPGTVAVNCADVADLHAAVKLVCEDHAAHRGLLPSLEVLKLVAAKFV